MAEIGTLQENGVGYWLLVAIQAVSVWESTMRWMHLAGVVHSDVDLELAQVRGVGEGKGFHGDRWGRRALWHAMGLLHGGGSKCKCGDA